MRLYTRGTSIESNFFLPMYEPIVSRINKEKDRSLGKRTVRSQKEVVYDDLMGKNSKEG